MNSYRSLSFISLALLAASGYAAWGSGTLAVLQMGDGVAALGTSTAAVKVIEFNRLTGALTGEFVDVNYNGTTGITLTGNTTGEGGMNVNGTVAVLGGYPLLSGTASASTSTGRRVLALNLTGAGSIQSSQDLPISAGQIRDACAGTGSSFYISTASIGIQQGTFGSSTLTSASTETNTRYLSSWNNSVGFATTQTGQYLVKQATTGTWWLDAITQQIIVSDFAISADGLTMYLASDGSTTGTTSVFSGGVWRFTRSSTSSNFLGSSGVRFYNGTPMRHITLVESGADDQVFATYRSGATSFVAGWLHANTATFPTVADWSVSAPTNTVYLGIGATAAPTVVTGHITLNDWSASPAGRVMTMKLRNVGSTANIVSSAVTLDGSGNYSWTIPDSVASGAYDLYADGPIWLQAHIQALIINAHNNPAMDFGLFNGDSDGSGEVDAADIDLVIQHFGEVGPGPGFFENADLDGSLEVDAADIDIVIANFGQVDN